MKNIIRKANLSSGLRLMFVLLTVLVTIGTAEAATYTVTTTNESGSGSLRDAIVQANANPGADTIEFAAGAAGTITLASQLPEIIGDLTISGPGAGVLTVSGNSSVRIFDIASGVTVSISGLTISNANAGTGGAISNDGMLTITSSTLSDNSASSSGGAIATGLDTEGTLTIMSSTLSGNTALSGGAIWINKGTVAVVNSTLSGNHATGSFLAGGGILQSTGTLTITSSTISGNSAAGGGGVASFGFATVTNSTFSGNSAAFVGGGILNGGGIQIGMLTVTNCTISGNSASNGGGIRHVSGTLTITSSTLSGNSASLGGGISNSATATVKNSIIADSPSGGNCAGNPITAVGVNFSTDDTCPDFIQVTPAQLNLGPLQDNGGPTLTHALIVGSVAIDAVTDCTDLSDPSVAVATDQRGVSRPQGPACDVGAFELETQSPVICPLPQGYWKNNPDAWPVTSLTLGSATYTQAELLAILNTPIGTGKNADASLILADQLIAAKLSVANGSDPTPISATTTTADELLAQFSDKLPYLVKPSSIIGNQMTVLAGLLEQYNKGLLTGCTP